MGLRDRLKMMSMSMQFRSIFAGYQANIAWNEIILDKKNHSEFIVR